MEAHRRHDISDAIWESLSPHLPGQVGQWGRVANDNRQFLRACLPSHSNIRYMYNEVKFMYVGDFCENSIPKRYNP